MGAAAVQVSGGPKYERTTDLRRMLTHKLLDEAIRKDWGNIREFLPARTATSLRYERAAKTAVAWNEGGRETTIDLPLENGWYVPDGNPFAIPNGKPSNRSDPEAHYLVRHQNRKFSGSLARDVYDYYRRYVYACTGWSVDSGVALAAHESRVSSLGTLDAGHETALTAQLVALPEEKLVEVADPNALLQRAEQLETAGSTPREKLRDILTVAVYAQLIQPILDEAVFLRALAKKIQAIQKECLTDKPAAGCTGNPPQTGRQ
ncbi:MAG TPA: hypothetical protein VJH24_06135 [Candidatus Bilamarchaeaceae archaeon]|nr:hypothetical protein [Candidatus Bilamarchaeaceae archaeon]